MPADTLTLVLATDRGAGPEPLTRDRPKAAVPFGGKYRVIDFTLANCLHSGLRQVLVLTQYKSHSLHKHLRDGWFIFNPELGEFITAVPPQQREGAHWYRGPFDAIRQNRYLIERSAASEVLVLDSGAIYRMDYAELVRAHQESGAQVTLAVRGVSDPGCGSQPRVVLGPTGAIVAIGPPEPLPPAPRDGDPDAPAEVPEEALSSMGVYCFDKAWLLGALDEAAGEQETDTEIALERIAPLLGGPTRVCGYRFGEQRGRVTPDRYWCNLDSIDTYYQANMALLKAEPPIDLYQADWNIRTYQGQFPPARTVPGATTGTEGIFINSMLAAGTVITGGQANHSILYPRVRVGDGAIVDASILFDGVSVGEGAQLHNCIVEKDVSIPAKTQIGLDRAADRERFEVSDAGIVVIAKGQRF